MFKKVFKWLDNYWYHYKWVTVITLFFIIMGIILISQMINREESDINILYTGPHIFEVGEKNSVESAFCQIMPNDFNGDGKKLTQVADMTAYTDEQMLEAMEQAEKEGKTLIISNYAFEMVKSRFSQEVFAGESVICLLDRVWYDMVLENDGFVPLSEVLGYKPEYAFDDYGVFLKDTEFGQYFTALDALPDDTILCMRRISSASVFTGVKNVEKKYEYHRQMFIAIFSFTAPN